MKKSFNFEVSKKVATDKSLYTDYASVIGYSVRALTLTNFLREQIKSANPTADAVEYKEYLDTPFEIKIEENKDIILRTAANLLRLNSKAGQKFGAPLVTGIVNKKDPADCLGLLLEFVLFLEENYKDSLCGELPWTEQ